MNGDEVLKTLKWITIGVVLAMLTAAAVTGSLGDDSADNNKLEIKQTVLERTRTGLRDVPDNRGLLPVAEDDLAQDTVSLTDTFTVTNGENNPVTVEFSANAAMYTAENVLDHIVVVTNTGNYKGYIRTWFAFEMGDLTEDEFKASVLLNQNFTDWSWDEFEYDVEIDGERYAVVCAGYEGELEPGHTTEPNLLQVLLRSDESSEIVQRLDGNNDGNYEIRAFSRAISDNEAWSSIHCPWNLE